VEEMSYPEKHSFCFSETREFILNGMVVPPLKIVEFLETGRIQIVNLKKENTMLREALKEVRDTEESESAAREMHAIAYDVLKEIEGGNR